MFAKRFLYIFTPINRRIRKSDLQAFIEANMNANREKKQAKENWKREQESPIKYPPESTGEAPEGKRKTERVNFTS